jgi:hypothetical protein
VEPKVTSSGQSMPFRPGSRDLPDGMARQLELAAHPVSERVLREARMGLTTRGQGEPDKLRTP